VRQYVKIQHSQLTPRRRVLQKTVITVNYTSTAGLCYTNRKFTCRLL